MDSEDFPKNQSRWVIAEFMVIITNNYEGLNGWMKGYIFQSV